MSAGPLAPLPDSAFSVAPAMPRSRTVTVVAWFGILSGVISTIGAVTMFVSSSVDIPIGYLLGAPMSLAAAVGLLKRKNWARLGYIAAMGLGVVSMVVGAFTSQLIGYIVPLIGCTISGLLIAKLCSKKVKAEFDAEDSII